MTMDGSAPVAVSCYFTNSAMASSASTPPVIEIGAKDALAATSALESMSWLILVASCATEAAKTSRPRWHQRIAPMHIRSEEHTSELQSRGHRVCRLLLEKK